MKLFVIVIPANLAEALGEGGASGDLAPKRKMDSRFRGNDEMGRGYDEVLGVAI